MRCGLITTTSREGAPVVEISPKGWCKLWVKNKLIYKATRYPRGNRVAVSPYASD